MVPVENSVEGAVAQTLDELATGAPAAVIGEAVLPVTLLPAGARRARPWRTYVAVGTHPHAEAQTPRSGSPRTCPAAAVTSTTSTAAAAAALADGTAAVGRGDLRARSRPTVYGLAVLAEGVGDNPSAETRFVLVVRAGGTAVRRRAPTRPRSSLYIGKDHPGALLEILTEFAVRGVNLTRIESRPTGGGIGDYFFSIDAEGHIDDARVGEALMGLRRVCADVRFLGSYPRVDGVRRTLRRGRLRRRVPRGAGLAGAGPRRPRLTAGPARSRWRSARSTDPPHAQDPARFASMPEGHVCNAAKGDSASPALKPDR